MVWLHLEKEALRLLVAAARSGLWCWFLIEKLWRCSEMKYEPPHLREDSFWNTTHGRVQRTIKVLVIRSHSNPVKPSLTFTIQLSSSLDYRVPFIRDEEESSIFQNGLHATYCCCHRCSYGKKLCQRDHKSLMNCRIFLIIIYLSVNLEIYFNGQIVWKG